MSIIKGLIFVIVYLSSLAVIYMTEYNTPALLCVFSVSLLCIIYLMRLNRKLIQIIQKKNELEERLTNQKNYFTEILTHDLKIPTLAQLRGLELLRHETIGAISESQKEMIIQIEESCKYILNMISMVLTTYKLDMDDDIFYYEQVNFSELLLECFAELSPLAQAKNIMFAYMATQAEAIAEVDKCKIKKAIMNLLSVLILYSHKNEKILVNINTNKNHIKFSAVIHGNPLSEEECNKLFADYSAESSKYTAVGQDIGLYLTKKIIDTHRGRIYAASDGVATNTFSFIIPQCRHETLPKAACPVPV